VSGGAMALLFLGNQENPRITGWELISLILNEMFLEVNNNFFLLIKVSLETSVTLYIRSVYKSAGFD